MIRCAMLVLALVVGFAPAAFAGEATPESALAALQGQDLDAALAQHEALLDAHGPQPDVYYNLGLIHAASEDWALAILNFERALALEPDAPDAHEQLEHSREALYTYLTKLESREITKGSFEELEQWRFYRRFDIALVSWSMLAAWLLGFALLFTRRRVRGAARDVCLGGAALLLLSALLLGFYVWGHASSEDARPAIIVAEQPRIYAGPTAESSVKQPGDLYRGALVMVRAERGDWLEVELIDGEQGWMEASALEDVRVDRF